MQVHRREVPRGTWGTRAIVRTMRQMARQGRTVPSVRNLALAITQGIPGREARSQALAIRRWLQANVFFTRDPTGAELLYTPARIVHILTTRGPPLRLDCDDVAVLAAALGGAVGLKARFQVVGFLSPNAPFRHVWADLGSPHGPPGWIQQDVTRTAQPLPLESAVSRRWIVEV